MKTIAQQKKEMSEEISKMESEGLICKTGEFEDNEPLYTATEKGKALFRKYQQTAKAMPLFVKGPRVL